MYKLKNLNKFILFTVLITAVACGKKEKAEEQEQVIPVKVEEVKKSEIVMHIRTSGKLESSSESNLSFKIPGIIKSIDVKEGEIVKKGEVLASLDLSEIKANVAKAENGYQKAKRDFARAENLYNDNVVTLEQFQNAKTGLEVAESDLKIAKFNLEYSVIKAPADGKILKKYADENELINSGYPVVSFGTSGGNWKMTAGVSDVDIVKISLNDSASVKFDAFPGIEFSAVVSAVGQGADPRTGTYEIQLIISKNNYPLVSGLIGKIELYPKNKSAYVLAPVNALVEASMNTGYVYFPLNGNNVKKQKVSIIGFYNNMAVVSDGLTNGDKIITSGAEYLTERSVISINN